MSHSDNGQGNGRTYPGFKGKIGRTFRSSEPWWPPRTAAPKESPNVVVVLADDIGFSDWGCYGSELSTPNIDRLAASGAQFVNYHSTPLCSPTRAALMTGRNPHSVGMGYVANLDPGFPGYTAVLPENQPTMAEVFRANGYSTFMLGKWHLTRDSECSEAGDKSSWPLQRGFDEFYGFLDPMTNLHHPHRLYDGNSVVQTDRYEPGYYLTDDLTDRAVSMIKATKTANPDKPFFMYFAHGAVHAPLHAKREDIARHMGKYGIGWDALREQRLARQKELDVVARDTVLPPRNAEPGEEVQVWDELPAEVQNLFARYMEVYAAMVESIDQSVGRLMQTLEQLGELDNTVIIVTSDNGASREGQAQGASNYQRGVLPEPGKRALGEDSLRFDLEHIDDIGGPNTWPHYPRGWAMACNTPFRLYKTTTFAGGHRVPFVVGLPERLRAEASGLRRQYVHVVDVLPTLVDLLNLRMPAERHGLAADPMDGQSFARALRSIDAQVGRDEQYYECIGNRAYYKDGWEVVTKRVPSTPFSEEKWALYNLEEDPTQLNDLSDRHPERVKEMVEAWEKAAWDNQVFPLYEGDGIWQLIRPEWEKVLSRPVRLLPGTPTTERYRTLQLLNGRSFQVVVDWSYFHGDEGVVFAHGGQESGYVLYVEDNRLHFVENYGSQMIELPSVELPSTSQQVVVEFNAREASKWHISLHVDGEVAVEDHEVPRIIGYVPFEGIDVGIDRRSPVSWELYERRGPFPFTGEITAVTYIPGELSGDSNEKVLERHLAMGTAYE
ncbi:arylsulfatase [Arthrobacter sp. GCM10027362]|uniref:arylsulfatase n=1 Tax=Arthrobacter sp. GCM10027362 TaxID=3273379 RepID=UPI00363C3B3F